MWSNHMIAFLLYLLLQVYLHVGISSIVSGFKNLRLNSLLNADTIVRDSRKTTIFPICKNSRRKTQQACRRTVTSSWQNASRTCLLWNLETCVPRTMVEIPHVLLPHLVHYKKRYFGHRPKIIEVFIGVKLERVQWFSVLQTKILGQVKQCTQKEGHPVQK